VVAGGEEDGALGWQVVGEAAAHLGGHAHPRREEGGEDVVVRLGEGDGLSGIGDVVDEALVAVLEDEVGASVPGVGEILREWVSRGARQREGQLELWLS
jgi:hypothetical protein